MINLRDVEVGFVVDVVDLDIQLLDIGDIVLDVIVDTT